MPSSSASAAGSRKVWTVLPTFDEADALFGKRTEIRDAHDKYANQEVAYLLTAIETHPGLVILATSHRDNIDDAFLRRLQASVHFSSPTLQAPTATPPEHRGGHRRPHRPGKPGQDQRRWPDK